MATGQIGLVTGIIEILIVFAILYNAPQIQYFGVLYCVLQISLIRNLLSEMNVLGQQKEKENIITLIMTIGILVLQINHQNNFSEITYQQLSNIMDLQNDQASCNDQNEENESDGENKTQEQDRVKGSKKNKTECKTTSKAKKNQ